MPTLRDTSRQAVRDRVTGVAMELFAEQGYDATTVEQIAAAAGMSSRTFFRYFAVKEDVVIGDPEDLGGRFAELLAARPGREASRVALTFALGELAEEVEANTSALAITRLMQSTPALRARRLEKQRAWVELLLPEVRRRFGAGERPELVSQALIGATIAAFDAALVAWAAEDGATPLGELVDAAMRAVRGS
jgi:AcrR family transcriptional regulator